MKTIYRVFLDTDISVDVSDRLDKFVVVAGGKHFVGSKKKDPERGDYWIVAWGDADKNGRWLSTYTASTTVQDSSERGDR